MKKFVFSVWLTLIPTAITSNVVPHLTASQCPIYQQSAFKNLPNNYQQDASQSSPYSQDFRAQNPPNQPNDGSINQLLINKVFGNPCIQKILNPNTRLYNQNGQEIQRQPISGTPNIINNYFIVPPEFFQLNDTKPAKKANKIQKRRRNNSNRNSKRNKKIETGVKKEGIVINDSERQSRQKTKNSNQKEENKTKNKKSSKIVTAETEQDFNKPEPGTKRNKKKRKPTTPKRTETVVLTPLIDDSAEESVYEDKSIVTENVKNKKRKQSKTVKEESIIPLDFQERDIEVSDNNNSKIKRTKPNTKEKKSHEDSLEINTESHLKNIELPVDNNDAKDLKSNNRISKQKDTRKTRNSKPDRVKQTQTQKNVQPDDIFRNFFPHMYMGSNFYSDTNYPFNYEQFYKSLFERNDSKNRNTRKKKNKVEDSKKEVLPNVVEVKLKPKNETVTTSTSPTRLETKGVQLDFTSTEPTTIVVDSTPIEIVTDIPMETPQEVSPKQKKEEEPTTSSPKTISIAKKANLEMPPMLIEDLHEFITPELGREDIVPTIHTNGLISDYYPIFFDDPKLESGESYYLKDFEDGRHFYTTDNHETLLNRDRRKYDEEYQRHNLDIRDRINFRRGKYRQKEGDEENSIPRPLTLEKLIENDESKKEVKFQTPPTLENPDFKTKRIEKSNMEHDVESLMLRQPVFSELENVPDYTHSTKPVQFSRLTIWDSDNKEIAVTEKNKPKNDKIETVFAKTRVVKYGVATDESGEADFDLSKENDKNDKYFSDGHTTYVVAKSLGHIDDFYW